MSDVKSLFRLLTLTDVLGAQRLRELAKWNQTDNDWKNLIAFEPRGCFAAEMDGKVVGTATCTRFTPDTGSGSFGWVGMVLVDPDYRRHGIGSTLLKQCIAYLKECGVETVKLDATPMGKLVYEKLGFVEEYNLERWEGKPAKLAVPSGVRIEAITESNLKQLASYDRPVFGALRENVLNAWVRQWPENAIAARDAGGALAGYALARRGTNFHQIGPVIGDTREVREALLIELCNRLQGHAVIVDGVTENADTKPILERLGLKHQRPFLRMAFGKNSSPGVREKTLAICCPELG